MIVALSTLNPTHEIFHKSYRPAVNNQSANALQIMLNNKDKFFDGLPEVEDNKGRNMACFTKDQRLQLKIEKER